MLKPQGPEPDRGPDRPVHIRAKWFGGLAQLVATLVGSTKLLYAGPG